MDTQVKTKTLEGNQSLFGRVRAWLHAFAEAYDYDPQEYTRSSIVQLGEEVKQLTARLVVAEQRNQELTDIIERKE